MQYCLLFMENADVFAARESEANSPGYWGAWMAYIGAMREAGVIVSGNGLESPLEAVRVSVADGRRMVQDGPYPDARELLGGYVVLEVPDLETALEWAARSPAASAGHVEVRPVMPPPPDAA